MNTYTLLKDKRWGVRVHGSIPKAGDTITVTKKSGDTKTEMIRAVLWHGTESTGEPIAICAIEATENNRLNRKCYRCGCTECGGPCKGPSFNPCFDCE